MNDLDFGYQFPAIKGIQAGREYYVTMCPLRMIPRIFCFNEETDVPPEIRAQRQLNQQRIPELARYIVTNKDNYVFSSITASVDAQVSFKVIGESGEENKLGVLSIPMDARFIINDGQHRRAAIIEALKENPDLGYETISVVFFLDRGLDRCQQMFADLNRHAIRASSSIGLLYDHRDSKAELTRQIVKNSSVFRNIVELEKSSLSVRSKKLFTLSALYHAINALVDKLKFEDYEHRQTFITDFWEIIYGCFPEWKKVKEGALSSGEVRQDYIHVHAVVLQALATVGNTLFKENPNDWQSLLKKLSQFNWERSNPEWEGRAMIAGKLIKSSQNIQLIANLVLIKLGIKLSPEAIKIENAYSKGRVA